VTVDKERNYVQATPKLKNLEIYVEVLGSKEIPWSLYYVGFAGVAVSLLIAVMIDTPVFGAFDPFDVGVLTITAFGLSSIVHHIIGKRTRLGNAEKPPELRKYSDILLAVNGEASHAWGIPVSRRWQRVSTLRRP